MVADRVDAAFISSAWLEPADQQIPSLDAYPSSFERTPPYGKPAEPCVVPAHDAEHTRISPRQSSSELLGPYRRFATRPRSSAATVKCTKRANAFPRSPFAGRNMKRS